MTTPELKELEYRYARLQSELSAEYAQRRRDFGAIHAIQAEMQVVRERFTALKREQMKTYNTSNMDIKYNEKGQAKGRVCVACTLASMGIGEVWETTEKEAAKDTYIRVCAARLGKTTGRRFSVNSKVEDKGRITVTRIA